MKKFLSFVSGEFFRITLGASLFVAALILSQFGFSAISLALYIIALLISGIGVYIDAIRGICRGDLLDEKFLMSLASIGAMIIGEYTEGVAVMLFFLLGEAFEHKAVRSSRNKIKSLLDICPDEATVIRDGREETVDADEVEIGDTLIIRAGERVPTDAVITSGSADIDRSALTGESLPMPVHPGSYIESGSIVIGGALVARAEREASSSSAMRILEMVEEASENKAKEESFITSFSRIYTPIVVALAALMAVIPSLFGFIDWRDAIYRALIFLVISCPCALVISVPMAFFAGIGMAASRGILFKGGNSFGPISKVKTVAFDKTGTLTEGKLTVSGLKFCSAEESEVLGLAAAVEKMSSHPIAIAISSACETYEFADNVKEISGMGAYGSVSGDEAMVGNIRLMEHFEVRVPDEVINSDESLVLVAKNRKFIGALIISDEVKPEAASAVKALKQLGVSKTVILSGDKRSKAEKIGAYIGIDEVNSEMLPEDKYEYLKCMIEEKNGSVMYVGDGINDAPTLALADVGVAMGDMGSDSAIESADVVITSDKLDRIPEAIKIAHKTLNIAKQNIAFALGVKGVILLLSAFGIANMWLAVFADVGVAVLAILNSMRNLIGKKRLGI